MKKVDLERELINYSFETIDRKKVVLLEDALKCVKLSKLQGIMIPIMVDISKTKDQSMIRLLDSIVFEFSNLLGIKSEEVLDDYFNRTEKIIIPSVLNNIKAKKSKDEYKIGSGTVKIDLTELKKNSTVREQYMSPHSIDTADEEREIENFGVDPVINTFTNHRVENVKINVVREAGVNVEPKKHKYFINKDNLRGEEFNKYFYEYINTFNIGDKICMKKIYENFKTYSLEHVRKRAEFLVKNGVLTKSKENDKGTGKGGHLKTFLVFNKKITDFEYGN